MKQTKISYDRVMVGKTKCVKITSIENVMKQDELPKEYIGHYGDDSPAYWLEHGQIGNPWIFEDWHYLTSNIWNGPYADYIVVRIPKKERKNIQLCVDGKNIYRDTWLGVGDMLTWDDFNKFVHWMKIAGSRLQKIRNQWTGPGSIEI